MNKTLLVIKREYLERVRSKWFLIGTLLAPLLMSSFVVVPVLVAKFSSSKLAVAIVDSANDTALCSAIETKLKEKSEKERFAVRQESAADPVALEQLQKRLAAEVEEGPLQGYVLIGPETVKEGKAEYFARNVTDFDTNRQIRNAVTAAVVERRLSLAGMDAARIAELSKPVDLKRNKILSGGTNKEDSGQNFFLSVILMTIIYTMTIVYGTVVMRGVVEEKQTRIVEVIISSMSPMELMFGKVIGIGLVGLTQFIIWGLFAMILPTALGTMAVAAGASLPDIPISLLIYFVLYFILGYFLYSTLYAMVGSLASSEQDTNQLQMPVTMLVVVPMLLWTVILRDPNSNAAVVLSLFPFFAPILMFLRITIQTPPFWQIALSIVLMLVAILACSWVAGKIYRVGILMYGKRPTLPELVKWLRYT
jgi:ABC-2 type transport system permease protein